MRSPENIFENEPWKELFDKVVSSIYDLSFQLFLLY